MVQNEHSGMLGFSETNDEHAISQILQIKIICWSNQLQSAYRNAVVITISRALGDPTIFHSPPSWTSPHVSDNLTDQQQCGTNPLIYIVKAAPVVFGL